MSMLEIKNVRKSFFTYAKPGLQAGLCVGEKGFVDVFDL